jgi:hypothetical protein
MPVSGSNSTEFIQDPQWSRSVASGPGPNPTGSGSTRNVEALGPPFSVALAPPRTSAIRNVSWFEE